jgi:hypothetical protein
VNSFFKLKVAPDQDKLVAPNEITLAQAAYDPASEVWGIFEGDTPVGLFAIINMAEYPHREPGDDPQSLYLWRRSLTRTTKAKASAVSPSRNAGASPAPRVSPASPPRWSTRPSPTWVSTKTSDSLKPATRSTVNW